MRPSAYASSILLHGGVAAAMVCAALFAARPREQPAAVLEYLPGGHSGPLAQAPGIPGASSGVHVRIRHLPQVRPSDLAPPALPTDEAPVSAPSKPGKLPGKPAAPSVRPSAPARIDTDQIAKDFTSAEAGSPETGANFDPALSHYFASLESAVRDRFQAPGNPSDALSCEVAFFVAADGTISHVRIRRSSGEPGFDQSVADAFLRTRGIGPRPDGHSDELSLTFWMKERPSAP